MAFIRPDAGLPLEDIILKKWETEWDVELKTEILRVAHGWIAHRWMSSSPVCRKCVRTGTIRRNVNGSWRCMNSKPRRLEKSTIHLERMKEAAMLFDPEAGFTWQQTVEKVWHELPPDVRAHYDAQLAATGQTREELCREAERDPKFPYGHDPLVRKA
jgi:hypothetical protein